MKHNIGKDLPVEFPRQFVPTDANLGDPGQVERLYSTLDAEMPSSAPALESWLLRWSELSAAINQEWEIRNILFASRQDDEERMKAATEFVEKVYPIIAPWNHRLSRKLVESPHVLKLPAERYFVLIRSARSAVKLFRDENVPLQVEEEKLSRRFQQMVGSLTVEYDGEEQTLPRMSRYLEYADREVRRDAWEKITARRLRERAAIDAIFDEMRALRVKMAANAGFDNYRDYAFELRQRFDYSAADCEIFHQAIEDVVVPLYREMQERRRGKMGLDRLRPWDLKNDPDSLPPLKPFTTVDQLVVGCEKIFTRVAPALGSWFRFMVDHELLDLDSRKAKAPGAWSNNLEELRAPFILANAVGVDNDVRTLLHECGHAFNTLENRGEPLSFYRNPPLEFAEVASMSMEFLGGEHLDVFYGPEDLKRSRNTHLEQIIQLFCWIATVDAFQHWIYTHPNHNPDERADAWVSLRRRFGGIEDWSGHEDAQRFEWHRQHHIFEYPFYYIEYGIAQLGALQVWANAIENPVKALKDYRTALALGGSKPLPDLFKAAGAKFDMSRQTIEPLIRKVKAALD